MKLRYNPNDNKKVFQPVILNLFNYNMDKYIPTPYEISQD